MIRLRSLQTQMIALHATIVLLTVLAAGVVTAVVQRQTLRDDYEDRLHDVAISIARNPIVLGAFDDPDPAATINPIALVVAQAAGVTYVVVTDSKGIRLAHPNPDRIGEEVSTDPSVPLSGETFVGTEIGTLGRSFRVKVPVRDASGAVIGSASIGVLESELTSKLEDRAGGIVLVLALAALVGSLGAGLATQVIRRRTFGMEPEEIADLLKTRESMLHSIREGIVAVDESGQVTLINDEARRLLDLGQINGPSDESRPANQPDQAADRAAGQRAQHARPTTAASGEHRTRDFPIGLNVSQVLDDSLIELIRDQSNEDRLVLSGRRVLLARIDSSEVAGQGEQQVLLLRDRTDLHELLTELDGAHGLAEGLRAQAHEFSNRMHVISGLLELGYFQQAIDFIDETGRGGQLAPPGAERLHDLEVGALLHTLHARAQERNVRLTIDDDSAVDDLSADPDLRSDVVTVTANLVENAMDASGYGGTIQVRLVANQTGVQIRVRDDGPGVKPEHLDDVFRVGFSTKPAASRSRGIGLALVQRIAERRQGSTTARPGPGGWFEADLPTRVAHVVD